MIKVGAKEIVKEGLVFFMDPANTTSYQPSIYLLTKFL